MVRSDFYLMKKVDDKMIIEHNIMYATYVNGIRRTCGLYIQSQHCLYIVEEFKKEMENEIEVWKNCSDGEGITFGTIKSHDMLF